MIAVSDVQSHCDRILDRVEEVVVGKRDVLELVFIGILADGHVLLEDLPGVAKTLIARSFAQATGIPFARVQFTPDLMPSDITGSSMFDQRTASSTSDRVPCSRPAAGRRDQPRAPKTQAALLEAMQERQVTPRERPTGSSGPSWCSPRRTRSSTRGPTRCPRRSSTGSSCASPSATRRGTTSGRCSTAVASGDPSGLTPAVDRDTVVEMQTAIEDVHVAEPVPTSSTS